MKRFLPWILYPSLGILIFFSFGYNQKTEFIDHALAQKVESVCPGKEIPVRNLIEETSTFQGKIVTSLLQISSASRAQIQESEVLFGLENEAKAENCISSCQKVCVKDGKFDCLEYACVANSCTGDPVSKDAKAKIVNQLAKVNEQYEQVKNANVAIQSLLAKNVASPFAKNCSATCEPGGDGRGCTQECIWTTARKHILNTLAQTRRALQACVTPVNPQTSKEEIIQRTDTIYSCQEAKFLKILNDAQQQCQTNNFFCCQFQVIK